MLMRFMGVAAVVIRRQSERKIPDLLTAPSSAMILESESRGWEHLAIVFSGTALYKTAYWLVVFFCNVLGLLQREVSLVIGKNCLHRLYSGGGH